MTLAKIGPFLILSSHMWQVVILFTTDVEFAGTMASVIES